MHRDPIKEHIGEIARVQIYAHIYSLSQMNYSEDSNQEGKHKRIQHTWPISEQLQLINCIRRHDLILGNNSSSLRPEDKKESQRKAVRQSCDYFTSRGCGPS